MSALFSALVKSHLLGILRDRVLYGVFGVAAVMILLVPSLSNFSMRQVQELAVTLSLSVVSVVLLTITLLLGASSIWRDVDRRYTGAILSLPISRAVYLLSKFAAIGITLLGSAVLLGAASVVVILIAKASYPSDIPVSWGNVALAIGGDLCRYLLLAAFALLLSSLSTSFYLPFFGTLAVYFCGGAAQEVYEYVSGEFGQGIHPVSEAVVKGAYYLLPNLSAFDFRTHAVYGIPVTFDGLALTGLYAAIYTGFLLLLAVISFERRELT